MFATLGRWCHDHRRWVLGIWIVALVVLGGIGGALGTESRSEFTLPDVESRRGVEILEGSFGGAGAGQSGSIVFEADQPVTDPAVRGPMEELFDQVRDIEGVTLSSPYDADGARLISTQGEDAGQIAYAEVELPQDATYEEGQAVAEEIRPLAEQVDAADVYLGGQTFAEFEEPSSEILGLGFAIVILILAFGSVLAMGLPIGVALFGIGLGTISVGLLSHVVTIPDFATVLGVMIGLGVGIDYALFIVTRYREGLHAGLSTRRATTIAIDTAGRAVIFAGTTVVISLLGMLVMQISFVTGLAVAAAAVVAVTMVASVTLLPALLGFAGAKVEVTRWRGLIAAGLVALGLVGVALVSPAAGAVGFVLALVVLVVGSFARPLKREVRMRSRRAPEQTFSYRWSRAVQHHPVRALVAGVALLGVLALPVFGLRLGFSDEGNFPEGTDTRTAYDLLAEGFGPGFNGPLLLATELPEGTDVASLVPITEALQADSGVEQVTGPIPSPEGDAALWQVIPTSAPQDAATTDTVNRLRDDVLPDLEEGAGIDVAVTGSVAVQVDFSEYLASRLLWFFGAVLTLSFLLLMAVFRSLLVPLKAVVMNLLSIGAAFGVVVAGFQWGWLGNLMDFEGAPIEPFLPMMLFAIVFGLSMDYEVFLLSRVREEWARTGDSHLSVANGLAATARVITAAALIMVFVFGSFLLENDRVVKLFGTGLATAIFLDATVVRMLLVPATMELLGDRNWWLPRWLDRLLPKLDVEGEHDDEIDGPDGTSSDEPQRTLEPA
ncbi:MMPL family transporter [Iamia majanohamensis]|uniref:MMPL family transporter n=1 Tax=Iamia majanohamensis TaxID=467976 RepID=A0AAE9Y2M7_9ACTN|nr:MMPL family transporter [Iamia majanohamensis]WCO65045.1 MMPL family transporter [Iamia majanohamensis]